MLVGVVGKANVSNDKIQWGIDMKQFVAGKSILDAEQMGMKQLRNKGRHVIKNKYIILLKKYI